MTLNLIDFIIVTLEVSLCAVSIWHLCLNLSHFASLLFMLVSICELFVLSILHISFLCGSIGAFPSVFLPLHISVMWSFFLQLWHNCSHNCALIFNMVGLPTSVTFLLKDFWQCKHCIYFQWITQMLWFSWYNFHWHCYINRFLVCKWSTHYTHVYLAIDLPFNNIMWFVCFIIEQYKMRIYAFICVYLIYLSLFDIY